MPTIKKTNCWRGAGFALLAAGALLLWPVTALALTATTKTAADICLNATHADTDGDGFSDLQECTGIQTAGTANGNKFIYGCNTATCGSDVLDPSTADLFYLLSDMGDADLQTGLLYDAVNRNGSNNALRFYKEGLVYLRTHYLTSDYCGNDRLITTNPSNNQAVRAARFRDQPSTTLAGTDVGKTTPSTPNIGNISSIIYTGRIKRDVDNNSFCQTPLGRCSIVGTSIINTISNQQIIDYYILQVVSHEMGHGSRLGAAGYVDANNHYSKAGSGTIMGPGVKVSKGIYTIPVEFYPNRDFVAVTLK